MTLATVAFHDRVAVVFDFDGTLADDSFDALLAHRGVDPGRWRRERLWPLLEAGWETELAHVWSLLALPGGGGRPVTADALAEVGRSVELHEGVPGMFDRLRRRAEETAPGVEVEFYLLSSGFAGIQRATPIAHEFRAIWGMELHFDDGSGELAFVKQVVTHPEKVRYLLQLAKGLGTDGSSGPEDVWREVPEEEMHLPLDQVIYVGDGASDLPAFELMHRHGGMAIAVDKSGTAEGWPSRGRMYPRRRVQNLAPPGFGEGSELMRSCELALESIARKVALRRLGAGE
jgi:phosphoserine phosphatase